MVIMIVIAMSDDNGGHVQCEEFLFRAQVNNSAYVLLSNAQGGQVQQCRWERTVCNGLRFTDAAEQIGPSQTGGLHVVLQLRIQTTVLLCTPLHPYIYICVLVELLLARMCA